MFAKISAVVLLSLIPAAPALAASPTERVVMDYLAAWNMHDASRAAGQLAYDVQYVEPGTGRMLAGRDATRVAVSANFMNAAPDAIWMLRGDHLVDGDKLAFEWEFSGTNTGIWPNGTAPSGKHVVLHGMSIFRVVDGKIVYQADYFDSVEAMKSYNTM